MELRVRAGQAAVLNLPAGWAELGCVRAASLLAPSDSTYPPRLPLPASPALPAPSSLALQEHFRCLARHGQPWSQPGQRGSRPGHHPPLPPLQAAPGRVLVAAAAAPPLVLSLGSCWLPMLLLPYWGAAAAQLGGCCCAIGELLLPDSGAALEPPAKLPPLAPRHCFKLYPS